MVAFIKSKLRPCHVTYAFQSESTLYSCLNVKELLARSRREIWRLSDCNWTRTQNHLVRKRTFVRFNKYCQDACNIKDDALCNNRLHLKAVKFCCKKWILDTSKGLDLNVRNYAVKDCSPHEWLLNWIRFLPNTIVMRGNPEPLPWLKIKLFVTIFWDMKAVKPFPVFSEHKM